MGRSRRREDNQPEGSVAFRLLSSHFLAVSSGGGGGEGMIKRMQTPLRHFCNILHPSVSFGLQGLQIPSSPADRAGIMGSGVQGGWGVGEQLAGLG